MSENGGTPVQVIAIDEGETAFGPQLLPGGEWVLFTLTSASGANRWDEASIMIESLSSGERRVLRPEGRDARYVPTGHLVYVLGNALFAMPFDVNSLELIGGPTSIVEGIQTAALRANATGAAFYSFSNDGTLVYVPGDATGGSRINLAFLDREGNPEVLPTEPRGYFFPRFSPDDTRIAVEAGRNRARTFLQPSRLRPRGFFFLSASPRFPGASRPPSPRNRPPACQ